MKTSMQTLLELVEEDSFRDYYVSHTFPEIVEYFKLPNQNCIRRLCSYWNIERTPEQLQLLKKRKCIEKYGSYEEYKLYKNNKASKAMLNRTNEEKEISEAKRKETCIEKYGTQAPAQSEIVQKHRKQNIIKNYGSYENYYQKVQESLKNTCLNKYGVPNASLLRETAVKAKNTMLERYGVTHYSKTDEYKDRVRETSLNKYGVPNYSQSVEAKERFKQHCLEKFGVPNPSMSDEIQQRISDSCMKKYGVPYTCLTPNAKKFSKESKPNHIFAEKLESNSIPYEKEFVINSYAYDFKVGDTLVEIDPFPTHNSTWGLFKVESKKPFDYHTKKSKCAEEHGYRCIHIWDWDSFDSIISLLKDKEHLYARNLEIREVAKDVCNSFLNKYHLQGTCKGQDICLGLYSGDDLIEVMTFGKPRYNKNYEYELLRLCTNSKYIVIGGAQKLFKTFLIKYEPLSIVSYCDRSKFTGNVYKQLGFSCMNHGVPSKHWFDGKRHFTDNLLRKQGADRLIGTSYGKGTSNEQIMLDNGFVEIFDCGQDTYVYKKEI